MGNHNIFIAECKYWSGAKGLGNTLDQLFRYVTWRDTKTSIIKFVDRKSFTPIVEEATKTVRRGDADREGAASAFQREYPADHVGHGSACREDRPRFESRQLFPAAGSRDSRLVDAPRRAVMHASKSSCKHVSAGRSRYGATVSAANARRRPMSPSPGHIRDEFAVCAGFGRQFVVN